MYRRLMMAVALLGLQAATPAWAAALNVTPTRVELGPDRASAAVTLENNAESPVTVQVQTFAWLRAGQHDDLEPTRDVLAVPPVFALEPKAKQIIRIALRAAPPAQSPERTYRLLITEVPEATASGNAAVRFALRLSLPIFVTPAGAQPLPAWTLRQGAGAPELELANRGTAHIHVRRIVLRAPPAVEPVQVINAPVYVLPGQAYRWQLAWDMRAHPRLRVEADTDIGPVETDLVPPPG